MAKRKIKWSWKTLAIGYGLGAVVTGLLAAYGLKKNGARVDSMKLGKLVFWPKYIVPVVQVAFGPKVAQGESSAQLMADAQVKASIQNVAGYRGCGCTG